MPAPTTAPTLTDGLVTLRGLRADDAEGIHDQATDAASIRWTNVPVPHTPEMALGFVERAAGKWADGSEWLFAVERDGRYAGNLALRDEGDGRAEIAYGSRPGARGTGTMEAACRLLLAWGFDVAGVQTVVWRANVGNWGSRKLAWRLGFTIDGVLRRSQPFRGELVDAWVGTLLADEPREPRHRWLEVPRLVGDGVVLRDFLAGKGREADLRRTVEWCADERTQFWLGRMPSPYTMDDAQEWAESRVEHRAAEKGVGWIIADPGTDQALGSIAIFDLDPGLDCEIGYTLHPDARGRGVMTAALRVVVQYAFGGLGLQRVSAVAALENAASRHVIESAGLRQHGTQRLGTTLRSGPADVALYELMLDEWVAGQVVDHRLSSHRTAGRPRP